MNKYAKMMLMNGKDKARRFEYEERPIEYGDGMNYNSRHGYYDDGKRFDHDRGRVYESYDYGADDRFRDRSGREHYDDGRFAPKARIGFAMPDEVPTHYETRVGNHYGENSMNTEMSRGKYDYRSIPAMTKEDAEHWMNSMRNSDGTTGPKWTMDQIKQTMAQRSISGDPLDFWVAMNMIYSDYGNVAKEMGVSNIDFYVKMAQAFLHDEDAVGDKLAAYYESVVQH